MPLPMDLVLVRHGESESNAANRRSRKGDTSMFTPEFAARPKSAWRLTDWGRDLARTAGDWVRQNSAVAFDRYYVSEYVRALETAALLGFPSAQWRRSYALRERDWGVLEGLSDDERVRRFGDEMRERQADPLHWRPPKGESIADVCLRVDRFLDVLRRDARARRVIVVSHGETMWAFRILLEGLSGARYRDLEHSTDPRDRIHNTQVIHYTRRDRTDPGTVYGEYVWMRSSLPNDLSRSYDAWTPVTRTAYTNQDLLDEVAQVPQIVK